MRVRAWASRSPGGHLSGQGTPQRASVCTLRHNRSSCSPCKRLALCARVLRPSNTPHCGRRCVGRDEHALDGCRRGEASKGGTVSAIIIQVSRHPSQGDPEKLGSFESHPSRRPLEGSPGRFCVKLVVLRLANCTRPDKELPNPPRSPSGGDAHQLRPYVTCLSPNAFKPSPRQAPLAGIRFSRPNWPARLPLQVRPFLSLAPPRDSCIGPAHPPAAAAADWSWRGWGASA